MGQPGTGAPWGKESTSVGASLPRHLALTCCMLSSEQRMTVKVASPAHAHSMSRESGPYC